MAEFGNVLSEYRPAWIIEIAFSRTDAILMMKNVRQLKGRPREQWVRDVGEELKKWNAQTYNLCAPFLPEEIDTH
jgi:hypothetical protein